MGKIRNSVILALTIGAICFLAFLPNITGWARDRADLEQVDYRDSAQVQLEIREDMPLLGKLSLLCRMEGVLEVPEAMAKMTVEEAEQAAVDALKPYMEAGLIPEFTVWQVVARPLLILTPEEVDLAGLVWATTILADEEGVLNVSVDIDDATGTLLRLNFNYEYWGKTDLSGSLSRFGEVYFAGLGVADYEQYATDDLEKRYIGDDTVAQRYRLEDPVYGHANLDLYVHRYGFYVTTPIV